MPIIDRPNRYTDTMTPMLKLMREHFLYLMKNAVDIHIVPISETGQDCMVIEYKDKFTRSYTFTDRDDLLEQLREANTALRPREAWEFHH